MGDKWQGWSAAAGVLMVIVGEFKAISVFIGLLNDQWLVRGFSGYYFADISVLAWWYLIVGVILAFAGWAVLNGQAWAGGSACSRWASLSSPSLSGSRSTPSGQSS